MKTLAAGLSTIESIKGVLAVVAGFVIFIGSIYLLAAAVFGRVMGYLLTAVCFFGMMVIISLIFVLGVPGSTPANQGPRSTEPNWQTVAAGERISSPAFESVAKYPAKPWEAPAGAHVDDVETVSTAIQEFLAEEATKESGEEVSPTQFTVQNVRFTVDNGVELAAGQAYFNDGGPLVTAFVVFSEGRVPIFSWGFLIVSLIAFAGHLPFLDRAEKSRKDILTGGTAPPFLGPA